MQEEFSKRNKTPQSIRNSIRKESRPRSQDSPDVQFRINSIQDENVNDYKTTPQRSGSRKSLNGRQRRLSEGSERKQQSTNSKQKQNQYDDNQYYDDPYQYQPQFNHRKQQSFSPPHSNDIGDYNQQYNQSPNHPYSPLQDNRKNKSPQRFQNSNNGNETSGYNQNQYQQFQGPQEYPNRKQFNRQKSLSPEKDQPNKTNNYNKRFSIKDNNEEQELVGHSELVPAEDYYSNEHINKKQQFENDGQYASQKIKISPSQQEGINQYQSQPNNGRDNRWNGGDYESYYNSQYQRPDVRPNSGNNRGRGYEQDNYYQGDNHHNHPPHHYDMRDERIRALEQRCQHYENQLSRINYNFEDFKQKAFKDNQANKSAILNYEDTIQNLQDRLYEVQTNEDTLKLENEKLKQKINHEQLIRTKLDEDVREITNQFEETKDQLVEARRENLRKEDEIIHMKNQIDAQKQKFVQQQTQQDKFVNQLRDEKDQLLREMSGNQNNNRQIVELQEKQSSVINENKRLYNEVDDMKRQISDMNYFIEQQKNDIYNAKHQLIEKNSREQQLHQQLENSYSEILQLKGLLQRAEMQFMDKQSNIQPPLIQPIPFSSQSSGNLNVSQQFKTLNQPEYEKRNQFQNNRGSMNNNSYIMDQSGNGRHNGGSDERLYSQNSPQNNNNNNKNKQQANNSQNSFPDTKQISTENKMIQQQLKNKNTITPSNFLSWEVPDQHQQSRQNLQRGQGGQSQVGQYDQKQQKQQFPHQQSQEQIDKMYKNAQQQLDNQQEYVHQQFRSQNNQQQQQQSNKSQNDRGFNNERNQNNEYSQIYNNYMNDKFKGSPNQNNQQQKGSMNDRPQVDPSQAIKNIENNLMMLNVERDKLKNELQRLEEAKIKSAQVIRKKNGINQELQLVESNISNQKTKLREMNVLHPY